MIKDNRIIFGYGTIACGCNYRLLVFTEIKPPQEIGERITNEVECGEEITIMANLDELDALLNDIKNVDINKEIVFKGYILDFNNYNSKSVQTVTKYVNKAIAYSLFPYAC